MAILDIHSVPCELSDLGLQHRRSYDRRLHLLRKAIVEHRLANDVIVAPPARTLNVQADLAEEVVGALAEAGHVLDEVAVVCVVLLGRRLGVAAWVESDLVADYGDVGSGAG